ncbi:MAG: ABC transporter permease [Clostridiales bacterium]|nr:ABC transporter permease [Clostridiales bacterium]
MVFVNNSLKLLVDRKEFFINLITENMVLSGIPIVIITIIGIPMGIYMTRNRKFEKIILSLINFIYTIPSIAMFGILIPILGIGKKNAILALTIYGLLPVIRNTFVGISEVDKEIKDAAIAMGSTDRQLLVNIEFPLALPVIVAGFRTMVVMTIALAGIASFIGAGGLGVAIWRGITTYFMEMTFVGSILVASIAVIADYFIGLIEKRVTKNIFGNKETR